MAGKFPVSPKFKPAATPVLEQEKKKAKKVVKGPKPFGKPALGGMKVGY